jgi:vacuolar-type H+-ATPase subunit D/Vma8
MDDAAAAAHRAIAHLVAQAEAKVTIEALVNRAEVTIERDYASKLESALTTVRDYARSVEAERDGLRQQQAAAAAAAAALRREVEQEMWRVAKQLDDHNVCVLPPFYA